MSPAGVPALRIRSLTDAPADGARHASDRRPAPIFGTVRHMSSENTARKLDVKGYIGLRR